jgi:hypothetical protein
MEPSEKRRATYQDVLDSPEHVIAEIIGGELRLSPLLRWPAIVVHSSLVCELGRPFCRGRSDPGGWIILNKPEIHLANEIIVPDIAGWRRERMPRVPDADFFDIAPDWACELLCEPTEKMDRLEKMPLYASWRVQYAWLIHPLRRTIEAFSLRNGAWETSGVYGEADRARIDPFGAIEIAVGDLWADAALPMRVSEEATGAVTPSRFP